MRAIASSLILAATMTPAAAQNVVDWLAVDGFEFASPATGMRFTDLDLRDPHVFLPVTLPPFPTLCFDFTDTPIPTTTVSFNANLDASYTSDSNPADGFLDASSLLWFRPLRQDGRIARVDNGTADCLAPRDQRPSLARRQRDPGQPAGRRHRQLLQPQRQGPASGRNWLVVLFQLPCGSRHLHWTVKALT